jgi:putative hydroxymethylpyrimidine transport system substrate-binding protein
MRMKLVPIVILALIAALVAACGEDEELTSVRLALDWTPNSNHAGLYVALEKGYFEDENLDVEIYVPADPSVTLVTVGAGQDDFGVSYQNEVLLAGAQGVPVVSVTAMVQHPLNSIMALESSGITGPGDLKGKTIGYSALPTEAPILETMLKQEGLTLDDVELVNVNFDLLPAIISGRVDAIIGAYWTHESIAAENLGFPLDVMRMEEYGVPDYYELVIVTSQDKIADDPDLVQRFVHAVMHGYQDAIADPEGAIDILKAAVPETDEAIERPGVLLLSPLWSGGGLEYGWQTAEKWTAFSSWMEGEGLLTDPADPSTLFTNEFVENAD